MRFVRKVTALFLLFTGIGAVNRAQATDERSHPADTATIKAITDLRDVWARHLSLREVDSAVAMYAPTAIFIDPHGTREVGRESLRKLFTFVVSSFDSDLHFEPRSISVEGDVTTDSGNFRELLHQRGDAPDAVIPLSGRYTTRYRRESDGQWKIVEQEWTLGQGGHPQKKSDATK